MGRLFKKNGTDTQPWDGITERQRRLSAPLPDYPMRWMKLDDATAQGYHPFAGFFQPHEYGMMSGFILDLDRSKREYCGVRDLKHAKGVSIFAKNGLTNPITTESPEAVQTTEATKEAIAPGFQEARDTESILREGQGDLESGKDRN